MNNGAATHIDLAATQAAVSADLTNLTQFQDLLAAINVSEGDAAIGEQTPEVYCELLQVVLKACLRYVEHDERIGPRQQQARSDVVGDSIRAATSIIGKAWTVLSVEVKDGTSRSTLGRWVLMTLLQLLRDDRSHDAHPLIVEAVQALLMGLLSEYSLKEDAKFALELIDTEYESFRVASEKPATDLGGEVLVETDATSLIACITLLRCKGRLFSARTVLPALTLPQTWIASCATLAMQLLSTDGPLLKEREACKTIESMLLLGADLAPLLSTESDIFEMTLLLLKLLQQCSPIQPAERNRFTASLMSSSDSTQVALTRALDNLCLALNEQLELLDVWLTSQLLEVLTELAGIFKLQTVQDCIALSKVRLHIQTPRSSPTPALTLAPVFREKVGVQNPLLRHLIAVMFPQDKNIDSASALLARASSKAETYTLPQMTFFIKATGSLACAKSGLSTFNQAGEQSFVCCTVCSTETLGDPLDKIDCSTDALLAAITQISVTPIVKQDIELRMRLFRALKRVVQHADTVACLALPKASPIVKLLTTGLHGASLHIRIMAGQVIGMLFQYSPRRAEESICSSNRAFVIQLLQRSTDTKITETTLFAWVEVAKGAAPSEMLVILTQLVEFLSHKNMLVRQSAVVGLKRLAAHAGCSLWALFSPYMRQISLQVCRKGQAQPQFISFFASLMGIHSTDFLVRNQQYLLPFLVIEGKVSLITEMAMATQQSVNNLIMNNAHFIFSSMLTSNLDKKQLMSFFSNIDSKFADVKLNDLICAVPIPLAVELLQLGGEPNIKPANIHAALTFVATVSTKPPASTRKTPMELAEELQRTFLTKHSLGIVGHLSEALNNAHGRKGLLEKVRIIRAFYDLVTLIEQASEAAVPQIVVCLQAAILMPDLRQSGLIAWHRLLEKSSHQVTTSLISHSMCLFLHIWDQATDIERGFMKQMFDLFIKDFSDHISQHIGQMPRITVAELRAVEEQLSLFRKPGVKPGDGLPPLEDLFDLLQSDNPIICERGLIELKEVITTRGPDIHTVLLKDRKDATVSETLRTLLDIVAKHQQHGGLTKLQLLASEILGMIGAVDPVRVDTAKDKSRAILLSSFMDEDAEETVGFVRIFLEDQLVEAFQSANNTKVQLSLAWAIQELLKFSGFDESLLSAAKQGFERDDDLDTRRRWRAISATSRTVFAPLLSSKWDRPSRPRPKPAQLPIIQHTKTYRQWLHVLVLHLLQLPLSENARKLFGVFSGILREEELEMANYLLPYLFLNGLFTKRYIPDAPGPEIMAEEVRLILETTSEEPAEAEKLRLATEAIFPVLDYLQHWRRSRHNNNTTQWAEKMKRQKLLPRPEDFVESDELTSFVDDFFMHLKPETLANGALRIGSYSRALYYWEQHIRNQKKTLSAASMQPLYATLQQLYINIDDPDGIEGVSVNLRELTIDQEILMHENAGRWTAAQSSYELALQRRSTEQKLQLGLLNCLRQTGHYDLLLEQAKSMMNTGSRSSALLDIAIESSWNLGAWADLQKLVQLVPVQEQTYDSLMGRFFGELKDNNEDRSQDLLSQLKVRAATELAASNTDSFQQCYEALAKLHIVHELDSQHNPTADPSKSRGLVGRDRFALVADSGRWKQHILSVRRVTLELKQQQQQSTARVVSHAWLESSKLARKTGQTQQAYKAILHALAIKGTPLAEIEHARWWWKGGHQLRAIQTLRKALASKVFDGYECNPDETYSKVYNLAKTLAKTPSEILTSKAQLLLTRWNDLAEHTNSAQQLKEYSQSARGAQLEKPHYFLGRYYMRLLEAEAKKPVEQQDDEYLKGEYHRHVVLSYGKAMHFGTKFIFQTLPSYLQLWLDFGDRVSQLSSRLSVQRRSELIEMRKAQLNHLNEKIKSFALRLPTYLYMLAFPQILSRLNHTDRGCFAILETILVKVLLDYPKQALWTFMAASKSRDSTRSQRGNTLIATLKREAKREKKDNVIRLVQEAQFVTDQLMNLCMTPVVKNRTSVSLTRDLHFDTACAPNLLVVPTQDNLTVILPSHNGMGSTKHHRAYEADVPTITAFSDEVDVMNSLQKPRKIVVRASDGILYPFLVKPNDDLRKDARLMDFNGVIQKFIRRDAEALKRTLRIRTYAVIALNEDHGLCEWVKNTRPLRDILIKTLKSRGVSMNYGEIKTRIETALGSSNPGHSFKLHVLDMYPPCFSEWFIEKFPDPSQWFTARLSYSRTLAVMSMVGFVLGLGDRHGENILFDETTGDAVHVDFNCLFEKGHTFEKPERVPFRLTHNLVDALGVTGVEGAFRKTCEITLRILRENQDAFNTVLESFLHDPVGEFLRKKKSTSGDVEKEEARKVLSVIASKLRGSAGAGIADKHVPLSIEGQADELIKQATDDQLLVRMYIGWTPWL